MASLRQRLGALVAAVVLVVTLVASVAIAVERLQEQNSSLLSNVELAAFQLSETQTPGAPRVTVTGGDAAFSVVFDAEAAVIGQDGDISIDLLDTLIDDIWTETTEQDLTVTVEYPDDGRLVASGVACVDQRVCDTVVVGAAEEPLLGYLAARWLWLLGPSLLTALGALAASRWLVQRSLHPVEEMRQQLEAITATDLERRVPVPSSGDELEQLGRTLNGTLNRLAAAVRAKDRFIADAAHELRSPLTGARAALEVEASRSPNDMIDASVNELDRAARLIDDLLALARLQGGPTRRSDVDFDDIVRHELAGLTARCPGAIVEHHIEAIRLSADDDAIRRVVANLLDNACRHGEGTVAATLRRDGDRCYLMVDDDGPGIPDDDRKRIFDRFTRLDPSRSRATGGTGLGLAIAHEIVADHNGSITVQDSPLGGARFEVSLPCHHHA